MTWTYLQASDGFYIASSKGWSTKRLLWSSILC